MNAITTDRTVIEPIALHDARFIVDLVNTVGWLRFIGDRNVAGVEDARCYLKQGFLKSCDDHGFGYYVVRRIESGEPMGICGFLRKPTLQNPDLGFAFMPEYYGQGFATEACRAVLDFGVDTYRFSVLDAVTRQDNPRSIRLLKKLGFEAHAEIDGENALDSLLLYRWYRPG